MWSLTDKIYQKSNQLFSYLLKKYTSDFINLMKILKFTRNFVQNSLKILKFHNFFLKIWWRHYWPNPPPPPSSTVIIWKPPPPSVMTSYVNNPIYIFNQKPINRLALLTGAVRVISFMVYWPKHLIFNKKQ